LSLAIIAFINAGKSSGFRLKITIDFPATIPAAGPFYVILKDLKVQSFHKEFSTSGAVCVFRGMAWDIPYIYILETRLETGFSSPLQGQNRGFISMGDTSMEETRPYMSE